MTWVDRHPVPFSNEPTGSERREVPVAVSDIDGVIDLQCELAPRARVTDAPANDFMPLPD